MSFKTQIVIVAELVCLEWVEGCEFCVPRVPHFISSTLNADWPERIKQSAKGTPL
jgi:hypothetical protein